jgi:hypothetical protein
MYLYSRLVRQSAEAGKMVTAAEKPNPLLGVTKIFTAAIVDNECKVYTSTPIMPQSQTFEYSHGTAKDCAIAFRHIWTYHPEGYVVHATDGSPWILVVSLDGILRAHYGHSSIQYELAKNVERVEAITGWYNINNETEDQGIIVVYKKKDNKLYIRNYVHLDNGQLVWMEEQDTGITNVNEFSLFRTNDFRWGIIYTDAANNIKYSISKRVYTGIYIMPEQLDGYGFFEYSSKAKQIKLHDTTATEHLQGEATFTTNLAITDLTTPVFSNPTDLPPAFGEVTSVLIRIVFNKAVVLEDAAKTAFTVTDTKGTRFNVVAVEFESGSDKVLLLTCSYFNNHVGDLTVSYDGTKNKVKIKGVTQNIYAATMSLSFTPQYTVPLQLDPPAPVSITNEGTMRVVITFNKPLLNQNIETAFSSFVLKGQEYTQGLLPLVNKTYTPSASHFIQDPIVIKASNSATNTNTAFNGTDVTLQEVG